MAKLAQNWVVRIRNRDQYGKKLLDLVARNKAQAGDRDLALLVDEADVDSEEFAISSEPISMSTSSDESVDYLEIESLGNTEVADDTEVTVEVDETDGGPVKPPIDDAEEKIGEALSLYLELYDAGKLQFLSSEERLKDIQKGIAKAEAREKSLLNKFPQLSI